MLSSIIVCHQKVVDTFTPVLSDSRFYSVFYRELPCPRLLNGLIVLTGRY